jgi:hypothetical protein
VAGGAAARGRRYWQCNNERATPTCCAHPPEYVEQLTTYHRAVKDADPAAAVSSAAAADVFSSEPGSAPRRFFDHLAAAGRDAFDLFSAPVR